MVGWKAATLVAVSAVVGFFSSRASAACDVDYNTTLPGYIECFPYAGSTRTLDDHEFTGVIGSDDSGQWVGWRDDTLGECTGWDWLGPVEGFSYGTRFSGSYGNDFVVTVSEPGEWFCGFPLNPPVLNGHLVTMGNGWYSFENDGADSYVSYLTDRVNFDGTRVGGSVYAWTESPGSINLSDGGDTLIVGYGASWAVINTGGGDDQLVINHPDLGPNCGGGWDMFNGEGMSTECEYSCANWPFDC
jgi:hypothetical protein